MSEFSVIPWSLSMTDQRLVRVHHNAFAYEAYVPRTRKEHQERKENIIRRVKLSAGLLPEFPMPQNSPEITNRHVYKGVAIYDVNVETLPGLRLTGNLYMPAKISGKLPGILCPHGHWQHGRVEQSKLGNVVMRSFEFARLGFVVFAYDMLGYNDNNDLAHRWSGSLREKGDFYGITPFGLQTANSLRALDLLASLPEVDPEKIGCTGASGGGSQTWFLGLLDERVKVLAPVCMLSSHFQGGCTCEEGPLLRTSGVTSFDIVSCLAPRPLLLPSVNGDWTTHVPEYEFPKMQQVYALYHAKNQVENFHYADEHNYNRRTCQHVYSFFLRHLAGKDVPVIVKEEKITPPAPELLWHGGKEPHPATPGSIRKSFDKLKNFYTAHSAPAVSEGKKILSDILSDGIPAKNVVERVCGVFPIPGGSAFPRMISRRNVGDRINALRIVPGHTKEMCGGGDVSGKTGYLLLAPDSIRKLGKDPVLEKLLLSLTEKKIPGMVMELLGSGASADDLKHTLRDFSSPLDLAFNPSLYSMRVQDILTVYTLLIERGFEKVVILSTPETAPAALSAAALLPETDAIVDLQDLDDGVWYRKFNVQPLMGRLGGIAGLIRLASRPGVTFLHGEDYSGVIRKAHAALSSKEFADAVKKYNWNVQLSK